MAERDTPDRYPHDFLAEAREIVQGLSEDVLALEQSSSSGLPDPEILQRIFRAAHSLKGLAGMFGAGTVASLAHALEDLLDSLRLGRGHVTREVLDVLFETPGVFESLLGGQPAEEAAAEIGLRLRGIASPSGKAPVPAPPYALPTDILDVLSEYEIVRLHEAARRGRSLCGVRCQLPVDQIEEELERLRQRLRAGGEVVSAVPTGGDDPDRIAFDILVASEIPPQDLATAVSLPVQEYERLGPAPVHDAPSTPAPPAGGTVRVEIRHLDSLLTTVGELGATRATLAALAERLQAEPGLAGYGLELTREIRVMERRLRLLREGVLEARLVPLAPLFARMNRVIRGIAREAGAEVRLTTSGGATEIDKLMVEQISDPLVQLLRNAVDHGIEGPTERLEIGKPPVGRIRLDASSDGHRVTLRVEDDGRGIDPDEIRAFAVSEGLLDLEAARDFSERETLGILFLPGFTTRPEAGEISGRGVGLDVVKTNIGHLAGTIDVVSVPGQGTTFIITLPITLAVLPALRVRAGGETLALPLGSVIEANMTSEVEKGDRVVYLRGETLPCFDLAEQLGFPRRGEASMAVVASVGEMQAAMLVDEVLEQEDLVIKPLSRMLGRVSGVAGVAEVGGGELVLVLDVGALLEEVLA